MKNINKLEKKMMMNVIAYLEKMINIYEVFEKPLIKILAFMEMEGIEVDSEGTVIENYFETIDISGKPTTPPGYQVF